VFEAETKKDKSPKKRTVYYETISRRVDDLKTKDYIDEAGSRPITVGKRVEESPTFGLRWKGFIASLSIEEVRAKAMDVLRKNPLLILPEKEVLLEVVESMYEPEEIVALTIALFQGFLRTSAPSIDIIDEAELKLWAIPTAREGSPLLKQILPQGLKGKQMKDLLDLLDKPVILQYAKEKIIPMIATYELRLREIYRLVKVGNEIGKFISELEIEDKPSVKTRRFLEENLGRLLSDLENSGKVTL